VARDYRGRVRWRRFDRRDAVDVGLAAVGVALGYVTFFAGNPVGDPVAGPSWFVAVFPVLLAGPLALRRRAPLISFALIILAVVLQAVLSDDSPEGLQMIYALGLGAFSVAAYSRRMRALAGLGTAAVGYIVYAAANADVRTGEAGQLWAASFFAAALVGAWLWGLAVSTRREGRLHAARAHTAEARTAAAVAEERARLARELHDVVSHHLSVVVVQASGARSSNPDNAATLEKIENSGRESLAEMRRLLGVLREHDGAADLRPQPGLGDLPALASQFEEAGLHVEMTTDGLERGLPDVLALSVYRIVQEALTNVLRHSGASKARVSVDVSSQAVEIEIADNGTRHDEHQTPGHGLVGMRERTALFGGTFEAGPQAAGGYRVRAVCLLDPAT